MDPGLSGGSHSGMSIRSALSELIRRVPDFGARKRIHDLPESGVIPRLLHPAAELLPVSVRQVFKHRPGGGIGRQRPAKVHPEIRVQRFILHCSSPRVSMPRDRRFIPP